MVSKVLLALCVVVAVVSAVPPGHPWAAGGGVNPWIPPWVATAFWYPQWTPCTTIGSDCLDCTTKAVCTKIGGIQIPCANPFFPYCNLGECSAAPAAGCKATPATGTA